MEDKSDRQIIPTRLKAAWHELSCWECRVTWLSWVQRLLGMKRGFTPKPNRHRAPAPRP